jgi:hypothetical protein
VKVAFIRKDLFLKKFRMTERTYRRKRRNLEIFTIELIYTYILIDKDTFKPIKPIKIKEFKELFKIKA